MNNDGDKLSWQQKVWKYTAAIFRASRPFLLYVFVPPALMALLAPFVNKYGYEGTREYYQQISNFYTFFGILLVLFFLWKSAKKRGSSFLDEVTLSFSDLNFWYLGGMALFGMAAAVSISAVYSLLPEAITGKYDAMTTAGFQSYDVVLMMLSVGLVAPVAEELIFRGYMLNRLLPEFGERAAVRIVTILFALCHVSVLWGLYGVFMGYLLCRVSIRHDNILYSLAMHIGFNLPSIVNFLLTENKTLNDFFFGSPLLIACYGALSAALAVYLWKVYKAKENL